MQSYCHGHIVTPVLSFRRSLGEGRVFCLCDATVLACCNRYMQFAHILEPGVTACSHTHTHTHADLVHHSGGWGGSEMLQFRWHSVSEAASVRNTLQSPHHALVVPSGDKDSGSIQLL